MVEHTRSLIPIHSMRRGRWRRISLDFLVEDGKAYDRQCSSRATLQVCWHKVVTSLRDIYSPLAKLPSHHLLRARIVFQLYNDLRPDAPRSPIITVLPHLPPTRTTQAADFIHSLHPRQVTTHHVHRSHYQLLLRKVPRDLGHRQRSRSARKRRLDSVVTSWRNRRTSPRRIQTDRLCGQSLQS